MVTADMRLEKDESSMEEPNDSLLNRESPVMYFSPLDSRRFRKEGPSGSILALSNKNLSMFERLLICFFLFALPFFESVF